MPLHLSMGEQVVRAYTNPTDLNYQDSMASMEWPQADFRECKRDPPTDFCFFGLCTYTFEYSFRFALDKKIKMNQWVSRQLSPPPPATQN